MPLTHTFSLVSLGCPKNLIDTEVYLSIFKSHGFAYLASPQKAEIVLINTCGFILDATRESIETILEIAENKGKNLKHLIVAGCLVNKDYNQLSMSIPEVDLWLLAKDFEQLSGYLSIISPNQKITAPAEYRRTVLLTPNHYAYLRISDGCSNRCTYCTIPSIRGNHQSVPIERLLEETAYLQRLGVKELIITAQDTALYGVDIYGSPQLITLLREIERQKAFAWIRLLYLHPAHLTPEVISKLASLTTLVPYFDIPLQHISDRILEAMNRHIDKQTIINRLTLLRESFPNATIRTTFITGFPSETRQEFSELLAFIKDFRFTRLGVFTYSPEDSTPAMNITPKVSPATALRRKSKIMQVQQEISAEILKSFLGRSIWVIIDKRSKVKGFSFEGRSYMDSPDIDGKVYVVGSGMGIGDIVRVKVTGSMEYDLLGVKG